MTNLARRLFIVSALLALVLCLPRGAQAQLKSVVVPHRDADITLLPDGDVRFVETWQVRFDGGPFTYAFRSIPLNRVDNISNWSVSEGERVYAAAHTGLPDTFAEQLLSGNDKVTWYFAPTSNAVRTFTLRYTLHGALRIYPGGDQFWWKFVEAERGYAITASHVVVHLPAQFAIDQILAAVYLSGGQAAPGSDGRTVTFDGGPFPDGTLWEIRTQFPHGAVMASVPSWQAGAEAEDRQRDQELAQQAILNLAQLLLGVVLLVGGVSGMALWYFTRGRVPAFKLGVEYLTQPPDSLRPGLAGALVDGAARSPHVVATLVDLARRGLIQMSAEWNTDYVLKRIKGVDEQDLKPYERQLLAQLFGLTEQRHLSTCGIGFHDAMIAVQSEMNRELTHDGYFRSATPGRHSTVFWIAFACFWGAIGLGLVLQFVMHSLNALTLFDLVAIVIVSNAVTLLDERRTPLTAKGATDAAKWRAFKHYLQHIKQYTHVAQAQQLFEDYLPYAVAFGIPSEWLRAFAETSTPAPAWYNLASGDPERDKAARTGPSTVAGGGSPSLPSMNAMAAGAFRGLDEMSASFLGMLDSAASAFNAPVVSNTASSRGDDLSSGSNHSSSSSHSWSGGSSSRGGGGGGGGSSGFG